MRYLPVLVLALSTTAAAQQSTHHPPVPPPATTSAPAPRTVPPPTMLPFPSLPPQPAGGLTTPSTFAPFDPTNPPRDLYRVHQPDGSRSRPPRPGTYGFFPYGGYGYAGPYVANGEPPAETPSAAPAGFAPGMLRFSVTPTTAQVFVDSYYAGTIADIDAQRVLTLGAGPHRIELRAPEYEPVAFDVRIEPNATITYRAALEPARPRPSSPRAQTGTVANRMYVIPNCYLGNVPPRADRLPRGCDVKNVHVVGDK
jgi:hypothetical protein